MENEAFICEYIQDFCFKYIQEVYKIEFEKNNNKDLEEFEISLFIEDKYPIHKPILQEQLLNSITENYPHLLKIYHKIQVDMFEDDDYNKGLLYEKICIFKTYKNENDIKIYKK